MTWQLARSATHRDEKKIQSKCNTLSNSSPKENGFTHGRGCAGSILLQVDIHSNGVKIVAAPLNPCGSIDKDKGRRGPHSTESIQTSPDDSLCTGMDDGDVQGEYWAGESSKIAANGVFTNGLKCSRFSCCIHRELWSGERSTQLIWTHREYSSREQPEDYNSNIGHHLLQPNTQCQTHVWTVLNNYTCYRSRTRNEKPTKSWKGGPPQRREVVVQKRTRLGGSTQQTAWRNPVSKWTRPHRGTPKAGWGGTEVGKNGCD